MGKENLKNEEFEGLEWHYENSEGEIIPKDRVAMIKDSEGYAHFYYIIDHIRPRMSTGEKRETLLGEEDETKEMYCRILIRQCYIVIDKVED